MPRRAVNNQCLAFPDLIGRRGNRRGIDGSRFCGAGAGIFAMGMALLFQVPMASAQVRLYLNDGSDDGCGFLN